MSGPFTRTGVGALLTAVALYGVGSLLGYRLLATAGVGIAALVVLAGCWVVVRPRVGVTRTVTPDRVTAGERTLGRLDVRNRSRFPSVPFVAVDRVGAQIVELPVAALSSGGRRAVHYPVPTEHRGRITLGPLTVERRDPIGLFRRAQPITADSLLWVHPRIHAAAPLPVGLVLDYEGHASANARLGTVTFASLRDYVRGDDPRRIHWRSTARTGRLIVREHIDTTEPTTTIVLDNMAEMSEAAFEQAVEVAASVVHAVENAGRPVVLSVVAESEDSGAISQLDRLAAVALASQSQTAALEAVQRIPAGGVLVVITGSDPGVLARFADQRRRFNPVVVVEMLSGDDQVLAGTRRRPGMAVLSAPSAAEAISRWNRVAGGSE
ncbi:MAG: DUF58 domain-containing protein [Pseudonocardiales bacterium]|nr:MAG: DUF58 domain-containing protein [Pseudonocardiales bacterium]